MAKYNRRNRNYSKEFKELVLKRLGRHETVSFILEKLNISKFTVNTCHEFLEL